MIKAFYKSIYLNPRFFYAAGAMVALFCLSFVWSILFPISQFMLFALLALAGIDAFITLRQEHIVGHRKTPKILSLGDEQNVYITLENFGNLRLKVKLIEELPAQLQQRNFEIKTVLLPNKQTELDYSIRPLSRGEYHFGQLNAFIQTPLGFVERKVELAKPAMVKVYPSIIQMKQFELMAFTRVSSVQGLRKIRRIGHSYEFEQIKNYVRGDDFRSINWKATSRFNQLMVNQYEDEKSQNIYSIVDKSRAMKLPFNGLTLMEHAINTSLVISNIILKKYDKAGIITFSDLLGSIVQSDRGKKQLPKILDTLYNERERKTEADYERLYQAVTKVVRTRSLLFLYTNFESSLSAMRVLPILRKLNKRHLLVVVFFENTEVTDFSKRDVDSLKDIYLNTIAKEAVVDKEQIVNKLKQFGIQTILTKPEELSLHTVNKYLELKARGMI